MHRNIVASILITCVSFCVSQNEESRVVTLTQGPVRGYKASGSDVFEFLGIPYATTPTGADRFKAPLPPPNWTLTYDADNGLITCPQSPIFAGGLDMREDCLVANVLVPDTQQTNLPVLIYVHGGAYIAGFGQEATPKPLVESKRIIAVTFNYRLGAHGFLCLGTEDVPGNAGLKDMLALLRWVKDNIADFGGNPDDVTLAGYSAGSSAVDLLMLSNSTEGLFNKVIPESGANVAAWSVQIDPIKTAQEYAKRLQFSHTDDLTSLEKFYKTLELDVLVSDMTGMTTYNTDLGFTPCLEKDFGQERILVDSPVNVLKQGDYRRLPMLYGFANMEGMFRMPEFDSWSIEMNKNFSNFLTLDLQFENSTQRDAVAQDIKEYYFGDRPVGLYTLFDYLNYFSDVMFHYPTLRSVKLQVEAGNNNIYLYEYTFYNNYLPVEGVPDVVTNFPGADHCAQTFAVLDATRTPLAEESLTEQFKQLRVRMRELWLNFITSGNPVPAGSSFPAWPPAGSDRSPYMILDHEMRLGGVLNEGRTKFWDNIYEQYYRHPEPPKELENTGSGYAFTSSIVLNLLAFCVLRVINRF